MEGDAEKLPIADNTFDIYTLAFGIRNCTDVQQVSHIVCEVTSNLIFKKR